MEHFVKYIVENNYKLLNKLRNEIIVDIDHQGKRQVNLATSPFYKNRKLEQTEIIKLVLTTVVVIDKMLKLPKCGWSESDLHRHLYNSIEYYQHRFETNLIADFNYPFIENKEIDEDLINKNQARYKAMDGHLVRSREELLNFQLFNMAIFPITVQKFKTEHYDKTEIVEYLFTIDEGKRNWNLTYQCSRNELLKFKEQIDKILADTSTAEILCVSVKDAETIDKHHQTDIICIGCKFKMTFNCLICLFELQSPLERKLFLELRKSNLHFNHQYALNWKGEQIDIIGKSYNNPFNNFKDVLTIADFYIEKGDIKLCIYTDGHSYHERTEEQSQHDRNIDRKLQELGYQVLRYTGKDVNEEIEKIIGDIKKWIGKK
jgi:hypothetical protein